MEISLGAKGQRIGRESEKDLRNRPGKDSGARAARAEARRQDVAGVRSVLGAAHRRDHGAGRRRSVAS